MATQRQYYSTKINDDNNAMAANTKTIAQRQPRTGILPRNCKTIEKH